MSKTREQLRAELEKAVGLEAAGRCFALVDEFACPGGWSKNNPEVEKHLAQFRKADAQNTEYEKIKVTLEAMRLWTAKATERIKNEIFDASPRGAPGLPDELKSLETALMIVLTDADPRVQLASKWVFDLIEAEGLVPKEKYNAESIRTRWYSRQSGP